ncbi:hypothetical protein OYC64_013536 [Pagothenia borchgrevinki]|uniref:Uncharacterized protein n=1 Tax=Pagothenia borchgrevinki TaxID=8213 RepID=A0ABD2FUD5_PAGBO
MEGGKEIREGQSFQSQGFPQHSPCNSRESVRTRTRAFKAAPSRGKEGKKWKEKTPTGASPFKGQAG